MLRILRIIIRILRIIIRRRLFSLLKKWTYTTRSGNFFPVGGSWRHIWDVTQFEVVCRWHAPGKRSRIEQESREDPVPKGRWPSPEAEPWGHRSWRAHGRCTVVLGGPGAVCRNSLKYRTFHLVPLGGCPRSVSHPPINMPSGTLNAATGDSFQLRASPGGTSLSVPTTAPPTPFCWNPHLPPHFYWTHTTQQKLSLDPFSSVTTKLPLWARDMLTTPSSGNALLQPVFLCSPHCKAVGWGRANKCGPRLSSPII